MAHGRFYRLAWVLYLVLGLAGVVWIGLREGIIPLGLFLGVWLSGGIGLSYTFTVKR